MSKKTKYEAVRPGFWPAPTYGIYGLKLELLDEVPKVETVRANVPETMASFVLRAVEGERHDVIGSLMFDRKGEMIGSTRSRLSLAKAVGSDPLGLLLAAFHRGGSASVLFQYLPRQTRPTPSRDDLRFTRELVEAGVGIGLPLYDHLLVVPGGDFTSLRVYRGGGWRWPKVTRETIAWPERSRSVGRPRRKKWQDPANPKRRWAGTGTPPRWFLRQLAEGVAAESLHVAEPTPDPGDLLYDLARQLAAGLEEDCEVPRGATVEALGRRVVELARRRLGSNGD